MEIRIVEVHDSNTKMQNKRLTNLGLAIWLETQSGNRYKLNQFVYLRGVKWKWYLSYRCSLPWTIAGTCPIGLISENQPKKINAMMYIIYCY